MGVSLTRKESPILPLVPPDDCIRARKSISAQLDGELSELGSFRLAAHLRRCPACALQAQETRAVVGHLRALPLERPTFELTTHRQSRTRSVGVGAAAAVAVVAGGILAVAGVIHQGASGAGRPAAASAPVSEQQLKQQRLLAMLSTLDSVSTDRQARLVAL